MRGEYSVESAWRVLMWRVRGEYSLSRVVLMWRARERVLTESERELERERDLERLRGVRFLETRETTYTAAPRHPLARALSRRYTL